MGTTSPITGVVDALADGVTATTQSASDNSTKVATTAYVDASGGSGNVSKVGTPVDNQVGVWTGDGTIEGTTGLTYDGLNFQLTGDIGATASRITKGWFVDLQVTNAIAGSITGNAGTVTTITGLAPDTATTQATQASITTCANLVTVGTLTTGNADAIVSASSLTVAGKVELATTAEIDTGTDSTRAMPVDQFVASDRNIRFINLRIYDSATDVATGTSIGGDFEVPFTGTIIQSDTDKSYFCAFVDTAGTTGTMVVDVNKGGTTIMTTNKLDIESTEKSTSTATTQPGVTTTAVTAGDILTIDVDTIQTTAAKGLTVRIPIRLT